MRLREIAPRVYKGAQLLFQFDVHLEGGTPCPKGQSGSDRVANTYAPLAPDLTSSSERPIHLRRRDHALETQARELLRELGSAKLASVVRVEWNPRLKTTAGRADYREKLVSLNPLLLDLHNQFARTEYGGAKLECNKHSS